jgi:hypothetical protein
VGFGIGKGKNKDGGSFSDPLPPDGQPSGNDAESGFYSEMDTRPGYGGGFIPVGERQFDEAGFLKLQLPLMELNYASLRHKTRNLNAKELKTREQLISLKNACLSDQIRLSDHELEIRIIREKIPASKSGVEKLRIKSEKQAVRSIGRRISRINEKIAVQKMFLRQIKGARHRISVEKKDARLEIRECRRQISR